ncbi:helix-turn-helix transcriptional regulator [Glaciimonas immobilis]|uniref:Prophage regulatory protein n=1 Tax=Glaciimonas immobilis TaxID=728004 RepID=A0A840RKB5_9BURK|nr:AlpA family transcriptional regulator [Glaciimonas immobilis]KAF3999192.1 AlpA family transcriptional regulator [Glaciimonas immobilis]MBB5198647.1 prophage regulatory protein [Glaciimonas immobilis]
MSYSILRVKDVIAKTGIKRTNLYRQVKAKTFPAPINLGAKAIGWIENEVDAWIESRMDARCQEVDTEAN